jgi:hypothetical protein
MRQFYTHSNYTDALLNIAAKRGASDRIAAYEYCMEKKWLCGYGRVTDKGFHKVTANFYNDNPAIPRST